MKQYIMKLTAAAFVTLGVALSFQFAAPAVTSAQLFDGAKSEACKGTQLDNSGGNCLPGQQNNLTKLINSVVNILSVVVGVAAVIMIIINGLRFITSNGDANAVGNAKRGILYAIIGLVLVALAQFIVNFVIVKAAP